MARMIKLQRAPAGSDVATRAIAAIAGFVHIVGAVTGDTIAATGIAKIAAAMAVLASQTPVATVETKSGDGHVTERRPCPCLRVVAVRAQTSVTTVVLVVLAVTSQTGPSDLHGHVVFTFVASRTAKPVVHAC